MPSGVNSNVSVTGALNTTANTANQQILTYTVPAGKTLAVLAFEINAKLNTFASTATNFGTASFRQNGTALWTFFLCGAGTPSQPPYLAFEDPLLFQAGDVLTVVCTPSAATSFDWESNIAGFLK